MIEVVFGVWKLVLFMIFIVFVFKEKCVLRVVCKLYYVEVVFFLVKLLDVFLFDMYILLLIVIQLFGILVMFNILYFNFDNFFILLIDEDEDEDFWIKFLIIFIFFVFLGYECCFCEEVNV